MSSQMRVQQWCAREGRRPVEEVEPEYAARLDRALAFQLPEPRCVPVRRWEHTPEDSYRPSWVDPSRILLQAGFEPYHHTRDEILRYAVDHRGDAQRLLGDMAFTPGLMVAQYPTPPAIDPVYFVTVNGNHRRLVFETVGLPAVAAMVAECEPGRWRVWHFPERAWVGLFERLGLVADVRPAEYDSEEFYDPTGCAGWILPRESFYRAPAVVVADEIQAQLAALEARLGTVDDARLDVLRDRKLLARGIASFRGDGLVDRFLSWSRRVGW